MSWPKCAQEEAQRLGERGLAVEAGGRRLVGWPPTTGPCAPGRRRQVPPTSKAAPGQVDHPL